MTPKTTDTQTAGQVPALALAPCWPGLIPWLGEGFFRTLGYSMLFCAGVAFSRGDAWIAMIGALVLGHVSICTAEVVARMAEEDRVERTKNETANVQR